MAKKKSVVWIWMDEDGDYYIGRKKPFWNCDRWSGNDDMLFCRVHFERRFPSFKMPPNSLGKITNMANKTLKLEIIETK